jgi:predicted ester cyclase
MAATEKQSLRERREEIVLKHVAAENRHDVEATIATFHRPRYEVNGEPSDGESAVRNLLQELMGAFPDFHAETGKVYHADDAVIGEARVTGTHNGSFAAGRPIEYPVVGIFEFEGERLVCEKVYFDSARILIQIGILPEPEA